MMNPIRIDEYRAKLYYMDIKERKRSAFTGITRDFPQNARLKWILIISSGTESCLLGPEYFWIKGFWNMG